MGKKGDKLTNTATEFAEQLMNELQSIDGLTSKKMFGGYGIFHDNKMFGMVTAKGGCFFKANEENIANYEAIGSTKHSRMPYYSIPESLLEDREKLIEFAKHAIKISKA